eukprot:TRINITY_DN1225_c0_g1_i1.p1 TRINITY_DN1225_c0_g1~~TRINITY_DN1225_c0_g1_i1.p1  ORF type:complete len:1115 (+),score=386.78 TRINITY_DN1225_c0_g1_i1:79-3423(+)
MARSGAAGLGRLLQAMEQNKGRSTVRDRIEEWAVVETKVPVGLANQVNESLFTIGNGYIGIRACFEEGYTGPNKEGDVFPSFVGTFLNGFYEEHNIRYPESGHGWAHTEQIMLNVTDAKAMFLDIDGDRFSLYSGKVTDYERRLDFKQGHLRRTFVWESPKGKKVRVTITRLACLTHANPGRKNTYATEFAVEPISSGIGSIVFTSEIDGEVKNVPQGKDPRIGSPFDHQVLCTQSVGAESEEFCYVKQQTERSKLDLVCAAQHTMKSQSKWSSEIRRVGDQKVSAVYTVKNPVAGQKCVLTKYVVYVTTQRAQREADRLSEQQLVPAARKILASAASVGFAGLQREQDLFLANYWGGADIEIVGAPDLQQAMRFNAFHLLQSMGRDGVTNIPASGLSGERYSGHYFWDTEIYIAPFFLYSAPEVARQAVRFRISLLDAARARAREMGTGKHMPDRGTGAWRADKPLGALYPWRTIAGVECSTYFPAGSAQVHINADIAFCLKQYMEATNDMELLKDGGAEMLIETARFWLQYGDFTDGGLHFKIHCVTGPDEYTCCINNNYYTNVMAQDHLQYAYDTAYMLRHEHPDFYAQLCDKIGLKESEIEEMKRAAEAMYLPFNKDAGVHPQDDSFLGKPKWDFENNLPGGLLTNYHYMIVYSHQVIKQADLVLAMLLQGSKFTEQEKKRNFDFYEPLCTHDSSLSACVHGTVASEIGYYNKAYNYFRCTVRTDIDDLQGKSYCGIHTANMGGAWMCVVRGFGGMRVFDNLLHLNPYLPAEWTSYSFRVAFRGATLHVQVKGNQVVYTCAKGKSINFIHAQTHRVHLRRGKSISLLQHGKFAELSSLNFDSVVFDVDALLPGVQDAHFRSWRTAIDEFLDHAEKAGEKRKRTDRARFTACQYLQSVKNHVKGRPGGRYSGLAEFLRGQGHDIPYGQSHDEPTARTLCGIGNRKQQVFNEITHASPPKPSQAALCLLRDLRDQGIKVGLVSFSKSATHVITNSGVERFLDGVVTGTDMVQLGLRGKPYVDTYIQCTERMFTDPKRCVIFIDDPVGFAPQGMSLFRYAASVPSFAQAPSLSCASFSFEEVAEQHKMWGMRQTLRSFEGLDVDVVDAWFDES